MGRNKEHGNRGKGSDGLDRGGGVPLHNIDERYGGGSREGRVRVVR